MKKWLCVYLWVLSVIEVVEKKFMFYHHLLQFYATTT